MSIILNIDTATDTCSVSLTRNKAVIAVKESFNDRLHAAKLAVFIHELLNNNGLSANMLSAVAVSMGPGSYTGLRIGVSTAKGICYGAGLPLIAVSTLQSMCYGVTNDYLTQNKITDFYFCPMIDARRMEVYTSLFNNQYKSQKEICAEIIDGNSFSDYLEKKPVLFFGSGAEKVKTTINHTNAFFFDNFKHSSQHMAAIAHQKFELADFADVAYFEPFYLKDFIATVPKNNVLK